jgi:hypothetical protein
LALKLLVGLVVTCARTNPVATGGTAQAARLGHPESVPLPERVTRVGQFRRAMRSNGFVTGANRQAIGDRQEGKTVH